VLELNDLAVALVPVCDEVTCPTMKAGSNEYLLPTGEEVGKLQAPVRLPAAHCATA